MQWLDDMVDTEEFVKRRLSEGHKRGGFDNRVVTKEVLTIGLTPERLKTKKVIR